MYEILHDIHFSKFCSFIARYSIGRKISCLLFKEALCVCSMIVLLLNRHLYSSVKSSIRSKNNFPKFLCAPSQSTCFQSQLDIPLVKVSISPMPFDTAG